MVWGGANNLAGLGLGNTNMALGQMYGVQQAGNGYFQNGLNGGAYGILGPQAAGGGANTQTIVMSLMGLLPMLMMMLAQMLQQMQSGQGNQPGNGCPPGSDGQNGGTLQQDKNGGAINYTTHGGYKIAVNNGTVTVTSPNGQTQTYQQTSYGNQRGGLTPVGSSPAPQGQVSETGDPHENVTGVQNPSGAEGTWSQDHREIILGDGTVIDMKATAANGNINQVNIFDGNEEVNMGTGGNGGNTIKNVDYNPFKTFMDENQVPTDNEAYFGPDFSGNLVFKQLQQFNGVPIPQQLGGLQSVWQQFYGMQQQGYGNAGGVPLIGAQTGQQFGMGQSWAPLVA